MNAKKIAAQADELARKGYNREYIARLLGIKDARLYRIRKIVAATKSDDPKLVSLAEDLIRQLNEHGQVFPLWRKLRAYQLNTKEPQKEQLPPMLQRNAITSAIYNTVGTLEGLNTIGDIHSNFSREELSQWLSSLSYSRRQLTVFLRKLKKQINHLDKEQEIINDQPTENQESSPQQVDR